MGVDGEKPPTVGEEPSVRREKELGQALLQGLGRKAQTRLWAACGERTGLWTYLLRGGFVVPSAGGPDRERLWGRRRTALAGTPLHPHDRSAAGLGLPLPESNNPPLT